MELNSLGDYLYQYRAKNKLSVQNLHEITGVSQPYLSQIESGGKTPSRKVVDRIARGISNNDGIDIKEIHNKLLRLAGYSEINYVDSFFDLLDTPSLNRFNIKSDDGIIAQTAYDFPVNDLYFHLTDEHNTKMFKTVKLDDDDRKFIEEMIKAYLINKNKAYKEYDEDEEDYYNNVLELLGTKKMTYNIKKDK
ncbi:helix-turn-helix transcriptional regulator [Alkalibacillus silvisoli]|uniref:HTH cro/C1-type domain-containing protein n=1 Tax=Alkalibacillus silvisoli TaxID=392823 RepID=A0ABN0ZQ80_9BACI